MVVLEVPGHVRLWAGWLVVLVVHLELELELEPRERLLVVVRVEQ